MSKAAELANLIGNINAGGGGVNRNLIINGAMNVAQRGTSSTGVGASSAYLTLDRYKIIVGGTDGRLTMTQDSSAPSGFANSLKLDCTTADTSIASGEFLILRQMIEGQNLQAFAKGTPDAKPFAVSFYVKGNASATYNCVLGDEDNTRQSVRQFTVGTDWSRVELTFPADTTGAFDDDNANSLEFNIILHAGSDLTSGSLNENVWEARDFTKQGSGISSFFDSTARTFFITGVQLEVGQNCTEFEHEPFDVTLQKCHRYFFKNSSTIIRSTILRPDNIRNFDIGFPTMRASATATLGYSDDGTGVSVASQTVSADRYSGNTSASSSSNQDPRFTSFEVDAEL